jgi:hypothetical protein
MSETPREPDRSYDAGHDLWKRLQGQGTSNQIGILIAAIRAAESSALERLAKELTRVKDGNIQAGPNRKTHVGLIKGIEIAEAVVHRHVLAASRALASPAAAPAAERGKAICECGHAAEEHADYRGKCFNQAHGNAEQCDCTVFHAAPPSEPAPPAPDLVTQRNRFEKCAQLFAEIRGDWTDPRDACREGRKLCMEALADIDAALTARAAPEPPK